ncbi:MAG: nucleotide exchange factor GrpE [Patescibacteria group bacterium]
MTQAQKDNLKKKIGELERKVAENLAGWQRARADYENLQRESAQKQLACAGYVKKDLINSLLPVLNSFSQAFKSVPEDKKDEAWVKGFEYIKRQLEDTLKDWGIEQIKTIGEKFDPQRHEATGQEESKEESGIIIKEVAPGYTLKGETVAFAKVVVSK